MTRISQNAAADGSPRVMLQNIELVSNSPLKEGTSLRTGSPWKIQMSNFKLSFNGKPMWMRLTARGELADQIAALRPGTMLDVNVKFDIMGSSFMTNDITICEILNQIH